MITNQEAFDKVLKSLREQGVRSFIMVKSDVDDEDAEEVCQYRGPNGIKCAAGHLIPDEKYRPEMEGKNIFHVMQYYPEIMEDMPNMNLADALQLAHDQYMPITKGESMEYWENRMREIAQRFSLEYKEP